MKFKTLALAAALISSFAMTAPATAQEVSKWPEQMARRMTWDKDGMLSRKDYLDAMGKEWDRHHAEMMKTDKTMKPGMMNKGHFLTYKRKMIDPGKIGG